MANVTLGEILDQVQQFEKRLEVFYAAVRDTARSDGVRLLTHYLSRHRDHLPTALQTVSATALARIRRSAIKYNDTEFRPERFLEACVITPELQSDEFLDMAITSVEQLIGFYRWLAQQPLGTEAAGLVSCLLKIEETHVVELKKTKAMGYF